MKLTKQEFEQIKEAITIAQFKEYNDVFDFINKNEQHMLSSNWSEIKTLDDKIKINRTNYIGEHKTIIITVSNLFKYYIQYKSDSYIYYCGHKFHGFKIYKNNKQLFL